MNILQKIASLFGLLKSKVVSFFKSAYDVASPSAGVAVKVVNTIKDLVESPIAETIVGLTPSKTDDELLAKAKLLLPKIANVVLTAQGILNNGEREKTIERLIDYLKSLNPEGRTKFWIDIAGKLTEALEDGRISFPEAVAISQIIFGYAAKNRKP